MNIRIQYQEETGVWQAYDLDSVDYDYDGESFIKCYPIGFGKTQEDAIEDLKSQLDL